MIVLSRMQPNYFEYVKNKLHSFDVTWQPIREKLIVYVWAETLPLSYSVSSVMPMIVLILSVTVTFTMTKQIDSSYCSYHVCYPTVLILLPVTCGLFSVEMPGMGLRRML